MLLTDLSTAHATFRRDTVPVPELQEDGEVLIRELSGKEQAELQTRISAGGKDETSIVAYMLMVSVITEDGKRQFPDIATAIRFMEAAPAAVVNRLNKAIWNLNNGKAEKN